MKAGKKIQKQLDQRIAAYDRLIARLKPEQRAAYRRPGSRQKRSR